jgi:hypothetical protein
MIASTTKMKVDMIGINDSTGSNISLIKEGKRGNIIKIEA